MVNLIKESKIFLNGSIYIEFTKPIETKEELDEWRKELERLQNNHNGKDKETE